MMMMIVIVSFCRSASYHFVLSVAFEVNARHKLNEMHWLIWFIS